MHQLRLKGQIPARGGMCRHHVFYLPFTAMASITFSIQYRVKRPLSTLSHNTGRLGYAFVSTPSPSSCHHMSDLQALHKSAKTLILSLRDGIEQLEKLEQVSSRSSPDLRLYSAHVQGSCVGRHGKDTLLPSCDVSLHTASDLHCGLRFKHRCRTMDSRQASQASYKTDWGSCRGLPSRWTACGECSLFGTAAASEISGSTRWSRCQRSTTL